MRELYAFRSLRVRPGQIPAYLEYTETGDKRLFRMWINPQVSADELHPLFKLLSHRGSTEFDNHETIKFIKRRVFEPNYQGIDKVLEQIGIPYYDAWEICKAYKGRCTLDDLEMELLAVEQ